MKIGIIGNGFVGHAMTLLSPGVDIIIWDKDETKREPPNITFDQFVSESEIIFVAVPTPMNLDGSCHTGIIDRVILDIKNIDSTKYIVIRSTVPPGTSLKHNVSFMPEFLTEKHWKDDFINTDRWLIGTNDNSVVNKIQQMFSAAVKKQLIKSDRVVQITSTEAELIKYTKNCFLASKVSFFNEIYQLCKKMDIDFEVVRGECGADERIGNGHTQVPGHDGSYGYGGTCFPKDMNALKCIMNQHDIDSPVIDSVVYRNEAIDRPEKDWNNDKGRAVVS